MRGKLRDKRAPKRDNLKREGVEHRPVNRRDNRQVVWIDSDEENEDEDVVVEEVEEEQPEELPVLQIPGVRILR